MKGGTLDHRTARRVWHDRLVPIPRQEPEAATDVAAVAAIRRQVANMRDGLSQIESELQTLERQQRTTERARPDRFYEVLVGVYEHGIHGIDDRALAQLASANGYQRRGLNGFFTGARAALRRSGNRVVLTPEGQRLLETHLRRIHV
jgi:hypothetical protein